MTNTLPIARDATANAARRRTRHGGHHIPVTRPERLRAIPISDLEPLLEAWTAANDRAKDDYYRKPLERR